MITVQDLVLARDQNRDYLRREVKRNQLAKLRRGAYVSPAMQQRLDDRSIAFDDRIRALAIAIHAQLRAPHAFSHETAAYLWGLRLWRTPTHVHLRQESGASSHHAPDVRRHVGLLEPLVSIDGLPVTDLIETTIDCLTTLPPLDGLVLADSALAAGGQMPDLLRCLTGRASSRGQARARTVLAIADPGAESVGESWLRYVCAATGLPRPITQLRVNTHLGPYYLDLVWPEYRVWIEFDGAVKYQDEAFGQNYSGKSALISEKRREDALVEALQVQPLRVMANDIRNPSQLASRLLARFPLSIRRTCHQRLDLPLPTRWGG